MDSLRQQPKSYLIDSRAVPAYVVTVGSALFIWISVVLTDFTYDASVMNRPVWGLIFLILAGALLARIGLKIGSAMEAMALFSSISFAAPFCSVILAGAAFPLADKELADVDRFLLLGYEREKIILAISHYPHLLVAIRFVYTSLLVQPSLLLVLLWATGREKRGWLLVSAWGIALTLTLAIFTFIPAIGAPPYFLDYMDTLRNARDGSLRVLGTQVLAGIITFPSFHAAAAVLLAWGFAPIPRIGRFFVVWNILMFASALVASHYLVDLIAGGLIAVVSIAAAKYITQRIDMHAPIMPAASSHSDGIWESGPTAGRLTTALESNV